MTWDLWVVFGLGGQMLFGSRFVVQWISSERKKESHIPVAFWYLSLCGGIVTAIYAIHRRDPVFIVGQSAGLVVYIRNLMLIHRAQNAQRARNAQSGTTPPVADDRP